MNTLLTQHITQSIIDTQAIMALQSIVSQLNNRAPGAPALAQFYGATGMGKTTAAMAAKVRAPAGKVVIARAQQVWASSPKNVLSGLLYAIGEPVAASASATVLQHRLINALTARECLLIIDEADYLCGNARLLNTLRDIHDGIAGNQAMVLIGEEDLAKKIEPVKRMHNRFLVRQPCPKATAEEVQKICQGEGATIEAEVLNKLIEHHRYSIRSLIGAAHEIRNWAAENGLEVVSNKEWHRMPKGGRIDVRQECL